MIFRVGAAYNILRQRYARNRIIVIAQVEEIRQWFELPIAEQLPKVFNLANYSRFMSFVFFIPTK